MKNYSDNYLEDRVSAVFESDPLTTERYLSTVKSDLRTQPERLLMLAVLEDGIRSFQKHAGSEHPVAKKNFREAEEWIFDAADDGAFSFESICAAWNLDAAYLRLGLLHWLERHRGKRPELRLVAKNDRLPPRGRAALIEHRPRAAGKALMDAFNLTCDEAKQLVDADPCAETNTVIHN